MMKKLLLVLAAFFMVKANAQQLELAADINLDDSGLNMFNSNPSEFKEFNNKLYFSARNPKSGYELFSYDGTDVALVADLNPELYDASPKKLTVFNNKLFFIARTKNDSLSLFSYDGVSAPTVLAELHVHHYLYQYIKVREFIL